MTCVCVATLDWYLFQIIMRLNSFVLVLIKLQLEGKTLYQLLHIKSFTKSIFVYQIITVNFVI